MLLQKTMCHHRKSEEMWILHLVLPPSYWMTLGRPLCLLGSQFWVKTGQHLDWGVGLASQAWALLGCRVGGEHPSSRGLQDSPRGQLKVGQLHPHYTPHSCSCSKPQSKGICQQNKWPAIPAGSKSWEQMVFCLNNCFQQQFPFQDGFFKIMLVN